MLKCTSYQLFHNVHTHTLSLSLSPSLSLSLSLSFTHTHTHMHTPSLTYTHIYEQHYYALKQLIHVCKYSREKEISYNATKTVCMYIRPKHMYHIGPVKEFLYGHELHWLDEYNYLGYYIMSDFIDDRDLKRQARAIYSRDNMIVRKFSNCSVDVNTQPFRSYISYLYSSVLWLNYSTATFNMTRVAYNNVHRTLMGINQGNLVISVQITLTDLKQFLGKLFPV